MRMPRHGIGPFWPWVWSALVIPSTFSNSGGLQADTSSGPHAFTLQGLMLDKAAEMMADEHPSLVSRERLRMSHARHADQKVPSC